MTYKRGNRVSDREQIKNELEIRIIKGEFPENAPMLSVANMADEYQISNTTAMLIYNEMKSEGTLFAKQGTSTWVADNRKEALEKKHRERFRNQLYALKQYAEDLGLDFGSEVEKIMKYQL